jgi:hypothetical protein
MGSGGGSDEGMGKSFGSFASLLPSYETLIIDLFLSFSFTSSSTHQQHPSCALWTRQPDNYSKNNINTANMIDPAQIVEAFKTTPLLVPTSLVPTSSSVTSTSSVAPIPTVAPNHPIYERVGEAGAKTLWVSRSAIHWLSQY